MQASVPRQAFRSHLTDPLSNFLTPQIRAKLKLSCTRCAREKIAMTDRVKCLCSYCRKPFSERASRLKNGYQVQCPNCMKLITFDTSSEDANIRRPLKAAREIRLAAEEAVLMARMATQAPRRE